VQRHDLQSQIVAFANDASAADPQSSETASAAIRQLFLEHDIPDEITAELVAAWRALGDAPVAVRSSATGVNKTKDIQNR
jgi:phosphoenolpyruvate synthase/pyruvate phosphate dikinase